jgi:hypothetical protein
MFCMARVNIKFLEQPMHAQERLTRPVARGGAHKLSIQSAECFGHLTAGARW